MPEQAAQHQTRMLRVHKIATAESDKRALMTRFGRAWGGIHSGI